ncbi:MAG: LacI family DNA-binding transcriptional regulator [Verrucomicrobiota bacterium]
MAVRKFVKLADVAALSGVSLTTASLILNDKGRQYAIAEKTIANVQEIARKKGYVASLAAKNLSKTGQDLIAFIAPNTTDSFFGEIALSIELAAEKFGMEVLFGNTFGDIQREEHYIRLLTARRAYGVLLLPIDIRAPHLLSLEKQGMPTVYFRKRGTCQRREPVFMGFDDRESTRLAVAHLAQQGCRQIGLLSVPDNAPEWLDVIRESRIEGFRAALQEAGLPFRKPTVVDAETLLEGSTSVIADRLRTFLDSHHVDGLAAMEDGYMLRLLNPLHFLGIKVPERLRLIGCNNSSYCPHLFPPLSSIGFPKEQIGRAMVDTLMLCAGGKQVRCREILLPPVLCERESSE